MKRPGTWSYRNAVRRTVLELTIAMVGLLTPGLIVTQAEAQAPWEEESKGIPQDLKQRLYDTYENHEFTWAGKVIQIDPFAPATVVHVASPIPIPEDLRYKTRIDDRTYTYGGGTLPENRLHPGAKLRGKEVHFLLREGAQGGIVWIILETRAWLLEKEHTAQVKMEFWFTGDLLRSGNYQAVIDEVRRYLVPVGGAAATRQVERSAPVTPGVTATRNPLLQQAEDLERQADDAAAKAQELEQKAQGSGSRGFGGILGMKNTVQAKRWRAKEKQYREQAQQLRQRASQEQQSSNSQAGALPPSTSAATESGSSAQSGAVGIGCTVSTVTAEMAEKWHMPQAGVYVQNIRPGSFCDRMILLSVNTRGRGNMLNAPASQLKSREPIIILRVNQDWLSTDEEFYRAHSQLKPKQTVIWTYVDTSDPDLVRRTTVGTWVGP
jgi:hypothetical protein